MESIEPPPKKVKPSPLTFSTLPQELSLSILARIPRSYYSKLSLVSKRFHSLFPSEELDKVRSHLRTGEKCVYVGLQSPNHPYDRKWFSLWINPDSTTKNKLLPTPSSYSPCLPILTNVIGAKRYGLKGQNNTSSAEVWVYNDKMVKLEKAPCMSLARKNAFTCSQDGKLYVVGGCEVDESSHWGEVFDTKTQTWEALPDPGLEIRSSPITMLAPVEQEELYLKTTKNKYFVYLIHERRWEVDEADLLAESGCEIGQVLFRCDPYGCYWYDSKWNWWKWVLGLHIIDQISKVDTKICSYCGKLVMFWVGPVKDFGDLEIWCAVISLEMRDDEQVWGQIKWMDHVLTVPSEYEEYKLLHCMELVR